MLLRAAQLSRVTAESMGGHAVEINKQYIKDLEEALVEIQTLEVYFDHGLIHALLAKAYDKSILFVIYFCSAN